MPNPPQKTRMKCIKMRYDKIICNFHLFAKSLIILPLQGKEKYSFQT